MPKTISSQPPPPSDYLVQGKKWKQQPGSRLRQIPHRLFYYASLKRKTQVLPNTGTPTTYPFQIMEDTVNENLSLHLFFSLEFSKCFSSIYFSTEIRRSWSPFIFFLEFSVCSHKTAVLHTVSSCNNPDYRLFRQSIEKLLVHVFFLAVFQSLKFIWMAGPNFEFTLLNDHLQWNLS